MTENDNAVLLDPPLIALDKDAPLRFAGRSVVLFPLDVPGLGAMHWERFSPFLKVSDGRAWFVAPGHHPLSCYFKKLGHLTKKPVRVVEKHNITSHYSSPCLDVIRQITPRPVCLKKSRTQHT